MMAIITSDDLAKDVAGTETMISRHKEHRAEIDTRLKDFTKFTQTGQALIADGHFLSDEVALPAPVFRPSFIIARSSVIVRKLCT